MRLYLLMSFVLWPVFCLAETIRVIDGDTLVYGHEKIRLHGINAPELAQTYGAWNCGQASKAFLEHLIAGQTVTCRALSRDRYDRLIAACRTDAGDIGAAMVSHGQAWAFVKYSEDYITHETRAKRDRLGIWQHPSLPAWDYRAAKWTVSEQNAPQGCPIKGNISRNGKIYHTPWSPWYDRTRISPQRGERWFCNEAEAIAAGWRPAQ